MSKLGSQTRILFLASNPFQKTDPLDLEGAATVVSEALQADGAVHTFPLYANSSATTETLHEALSKARNAEVLHLYGHGDATEGWLTQNTDGQAVGVKGGRLARFLQTFPNIKLLILSACHQLKHVIDLSEYVDVVIGTSDALDIDVERTFTRTFYTELTYGSTIGSAYKRAKLLAGIEFDEDAEVILMKTRDGTDADWFHLRPCTIDQTPIPVSPESILHASRAVIAKVVDGHNDVVLTANVLAEWKKIVPCEGQAIPYVIKADVDSEGWHKIYPPNQATWQNNLNAIRAAVDKAKESGRTRVHLATNIPYSLGAVLGSELEQHNREIMFYQWAPVGQNPDHRAWHPWGPGIPSSRPNQSQDPFFGQGMLPKVPIERSCDVACMVSVSRQIDVEKAVETVGVDASQVQTVQLDPLLGIEQTVIDQSNIDVAVRELAAALEGIAKAYPNARAIHLFYSAPIVLLMRAVGRLHLQATPVYLYEWFAKTRTEGRYLRVLDLVKGELQF